MVVENEVLALFSSVDELPELTKTVISVLSVSRASDLTYQPSQTCMHYRCKVSVGTHGVCACTYGSY